MTRDCFFAKFEQFADAPKAVMNMRKFILSLAVKGSLVPQNPNDEPTATSIDLVASDAEKAIRRGVIRRYGITEPSDNRELPNLPVGWQWSRLCEVVNPVPYAIKRGPFGSAIRKDMFVSSGFKVYEQQHAISGDFSKGRYYINRAKFEELNAFELHPDEVLISCSGTVGKVAIVPPVIERGIINQALLKISLHQSALLNKYFLILFPAFFMETDALTNLSGTAQKNIPGMDIMKVMPFPLPPLAEQKRIIAKVDELMALCDQLEARQKEREEKHAALARASLARFADAPTPANLNFLFHKSYTIPPADLRKSILTLAVQGKLVPQDQREKSGSDSSLADIPFEIPCNWSWKQLGTLGKCRTGKTPPTNDSANYGDGFPFIGPGQMTPDGHFSLPEKFITKVGLENSTEANPLDILMVCIGGSIGKAAICRKRIGFNQQINSVRLDSNLPEYVFLAVTSNYFQERVIANASGSATPIINKGKWEQIFVPIPPLTEQKRIVAKVDQLMVLVDELEKQIQEERAKAEKLMEAIVGELTASSNP